MRKHRIFQPKTPKSLEKPTTKDKNTKTEVLSSKKNSLENLLGPLDLPEKNNAKCKK
jgi:hypothetical protein